MEIKSGATFARDWLDGIARWKRVTGETRIDPVVVYGGDETFVREDVEVRSWRRIVQ